MNTPTFITRKRLRPVLIAVPITGAVLLGAAGIAHAATNGNSDKPNYQSSITTTANEDSGNEASADLALTKAAKIDLAQAARAGAAAVPGGAATSVELTNEGGNVVYSVTVATSTTETDVIVDAGNAKVLTKQVDQEKDGSESKNETGSSDTSTSGTTGQTSHSGTSGTTGP